MGQSFVVSVVRQRSEADRRQSPLACVSVKVCGTEQNSSGRKEVARHIVVSLSEAGRNLKRYSTTVPS